MSHHFIIFCSVVYRNAWFSGKINVQPSSGYFFLLNSFICASKFIPNSLFIHLHVHGNKILNGSHCKSHVVVVTMKIKHFGMKNMTEFQQTLCKSLSEITPRMTPIQKLELYF